MLGNPDIWNELNKISTAVANLNQINVLEAPEHYFDNLAGEVLKRIRATEATSVQEELLILSTVLSKVNKAMPFEVELLYFDMFPGETLERILDQNQLHLSREIEELSPILSKLDRKSPLSLPEGYFETLNPEIPLGMNGNRPAKVISINRNRWVNYAAAAVVTGFIAISAWFLFSDRGSNFDKIAKINIEEELKSSSETEMLKYLEGMPLAISEDLPVSELEEIDPATILEDLPDNVLQKYLQENPVIREGGAMN
jgi:hypothetical protein